MEKHEVLMCLGMFIMILSFALTSANTLVGGKIYNSDFSQVIGGADVSVDCGGDTLDTISLSDGAYAVTFDSDDCYDASKVYVNASKGTLSGKEDSIINNSTEGEGEFVAVANVNIKSTNTVNVGSRKNRGTWFECGNRVCDSGESYSTCPSDCKQVENPIVPLVAPLNDNSGNSGNENNNPPLENQTNETGENNPGITGAVVGESEGNGNGTHFWYWLLGLVILLIIVIGALAFLQGRKKESWDHM